MSVCVKVCLTDKGNGRGMQYSLIIFNRKTPPVWTHLKIELGFHSLGPCVCHHPHHVDATPFEPHSWFISIWHEKAKLRWWGWKNIHLHHFICSPKLQVRSHVATRGYANIAIRAYFSVHINFVQTSTLCRSLLAGPPPGPRSKLAQQLERQWVWDKFSVLLFTIIQLLKSVCLHLNKPLFSRLACFILFFWTSLLEAEPSYVCSAMFVLTG